MAQSIVDRMIAAYPPESRAFVLPASKATALALLHGLAATIEALPDFERFPEGNAGVCVFALLRDAAEACPDAGDFSHVVQGHRLILDTAARAVVEEVFGER